MNTTEYLCVARATSDVSTIGIGSDIVFNSIVSGNIPYNTTTGIATLKAGKTYELIGEPSFSGFSGDYVAFDWVDTTSNTALITNCNGIMVPINKNSPESNSIIAHIIYTPITDQTIKLRITGASGTVTLRAGAGSKAIIRQIGTTAVGSFQGATASAAGLAGAVPAPSSGQQSYALCGSGSWTDIISTIIGKMYPVGHIMITENSNNPSTYLGVGTWAAYGTGRTLVGIDTSQTEFNTLAKTGGTNTVTLTEAQMPIHSHPITTYTNDGGPNGVSRSYTGGLSNTNYSTGNAGSGQAHNNLQPYVAVYMWKRTA
jgi:hypothetical protein